MQPPIPIEKLSGIGPAYQKRLKKLGIKTTQDILYHFPHRYEDFSNTIPISKIKYGENCSIQGKILEIENSRTWKKKMILTQAVVEDQTGAVKVIWFNQPYLTRNLKEGNWVSLSGKTNLGKEGLYLSNPIYEKISPQEEKKELTHTARIIPVYPETEGLSSRWLRFIIKSLLEKFGNRIEDPLPDYLEKKYNFPPLSRALWQIHFPDSIPEAKRAQERFSFEELFLIELAVLKERTKIKSLKAYPIPINLEFLQKFIKSLPFKLTDAQRKSSWQILKDLEKPRPMNRLLEGDVGSGKTIVAAIASLNVVKAGYQVAFMAPTEVLAKQHFKTIAELLNASTKKLRGGINLGFLTGKEDKFVSKKLKNEVIEISRKKLLEKVMEGEMDLLIGTQALIAGSKKNLLSPGQSKKQGIKFGKLALVIVDEQHRFGVEQRAKLCQPQEKFPFIPHLLSMTATPIPRTLALTVYGDLDLSLIDQLPKGRKKIITKIIPPKRRTEAYQFIRKQIKSGRQAFVICPRIESEKEKIEKNRKDVLGWAEVKAVKEEYQRLSKEIFPDLKVEMLHGKMTSKEKEKIMRNFKAKKTDILVSTSVVEVGIDIPGATVMMIEGAERFGLAQLYQLRGRVGRAKYQSYCFLFTDSPARKTRERLRALIESESGFKLAEKDLEIRGPGDFIGTRQWGIPDLAMSALKNISLVEKTREEAKEILEESPNLEKYPLLKRKLKKFREKIHLE